MEIHQDMQSIQPMNPYPDWENSLDLMFIVDCTSSMGRWINACRYKIPPMIDFIQSKNPGTFIRVSVVCYRDYSDQHFQYQVLPFTSDIDQLELFLSLLVPLGGNDIPEDVAGGLFYGL